MSASGPGWWRLNRWAVIALVPVLALGVGLKLDTTFREKIWDGEPRVAASGSARVAAELGGSSILLGGFGPATLTRGGESFAPPPGTTPWHARLRFSSRGAEGLIGCKPELLDRAGDTFSAEPVELALTDQLSEYSSCSPPPDASGDDPPPGTTPAPFDADFYFLLPAGARPAELRIVQIASLPRYARFPVTDPS